MYHATNGDEITRTNAAVLVGAFMVSFIFIAAACSVDCCRLW
jgi:hypothetical protein